MTPKGHAAVARAIEQTLNAPRRSAHSSAPPLPLGRSAVPAPDEWVAEQKPVADPYRDSSAELHKLGCRTDQLREWLRVRCKNATMRLLVSGKGEPLLLNTKDGSSLIIAQLEGDRFQLRVSNERSTLLLRNDWPLGDDRPSMYAYSNRGDGVAPAPTEDEAALCACHEQVTGAKDCSELYGAADRCVASYPGDCRAQLRCARGDRALPPACEGGQDPSPVSLRCVAPAPPASTAPGGKPARVAR